MKEYIFNRLNNKQQIIRFIMAGLLAFVVEYGSFYVLFNGLHWRLIFANTLSFIFALVVSFTVQRYWTFISKEKEYSKRINHQAALYAALSFFNLIVSTLSIETLVYIGLKPLLAKFGTQVIVAFWNYFAMKKIIFTHDTW